MSWTPPQRNADSAGWRNYGSNETRTGGWWPRGYDQSDWARQASYASPPKGGRRDWSYASPPRRRNQWSQRAPPSSRRGDGRGGFGQPQTQTQSQSFTERWTPSQSQRADWRTEEPDSLWAEVCKLRASVDRKAVVRDNALRRLNETKAEIENLTRRTVLEEKDYEARSKATVEAEQFLQDAERRLAERDNRDGADETCGPQGAWTDEQQEKVRHLMETANPDVQWLLALMKPRFAAASQTQVDTDADQASMAVDQDQCLNLLNEADQIDDEDDKRAQRKRVLERFVTHHPAQRQSSARVTPYGG
jgi:hypothetical protein